jgi:hypothetical protein
MSNKLIYKLVNKTIIVFLSLLILSTSAHAQRKKFVEIVSHITAIDVSKVRLNEKVWNDIKPYRQVLQPQFLVVPKPKQIGVKEIFVQSINNGEYIAFRLVWNDATKNETPRIMDFSDGAAIQFPLANEIFPEHFMGQKDAPVHILFWKAWRSKDKKTGFQTIKDAYPNMTSDIYTFDYPVKGKGTSKTQDEKNIFIPGKAAGNPVSFPSKSIIKELSSQGPGTITFKNTENTSGVAEYKNGKWSVVFRRPFIVKDTQSVQFKPGQRMPLAFAVWEGTLMESGGRKAVSPAWAEVEVKTK